MNNNKKECVWATLHKEVMPEKQHLFLPFCVKNAGNTQSISALFALTGRNICCFQVLRSFEVVTFLINKQQNSRNADAFREFFVRLSRKGAVQNQYFLIERCPLQHTLFYCLISGTAQAVPGLQQREHR